MNTPNSVAAALPQPESAVYTTDALALFKTYTRDSYLAEFGVQAPAWDPARAPKAWFDSTTSNSGTGASAANVSAPSAPLAYTIVGQDQTGNWSLQTMTLPASEAATVNLPGAVIYPPYQLASTKATRSGQSINPVYMVLLPDAQAVMAEVGGSGLFDDGATATNPVTYPAVNYPADEPRRMWAFKVNGQQYYAGLLLASKYGLGIGWPGHWDFSHGSPLWLADPPAPTGALDPRSPVPVPVPVRALLPNERLQAGPMGIGVLVARTDLPTLTAGIGGFTADDRSTLQKILEIVSGK